MACSLHAEDVKTDTAQSLYKLKLLWSREFPEKVRKIRIAPDGKRSGVVVLKGEGKNRISKFYMLDENGKDIWSREVHGLFYPDFSGNKDLLLGVFDFSKPGENKDFYYYDKHGNELWQERTDVNTFMPSLYGKYIGFSGILNYYEQSCMDWWELRDKDFNLLWKYKPKYNIDATLLSDGKTLMVEGREVKLFGKGGQELKKVIIPEIEPHSVEYQGCVNPTDMTGPLYLTGTQDGRYGVFGYSQQEKDMEKYCCLTLYSVDMEKGTWWSYPTKKDYSNTEDIYLSSDGKYLMLLGYDEVFLFDNYKGKLLWKHSYEREILNANLITIEGSLFVALEFVSRSKNEQTRRKWNYFVDLTGKRVKLFNNLVFDLYYCKQAGKSIVETKGNKVNKYQIISEEN